MNSIRLPSYAKINLGLVIKGKRGDGFHEIETLFLQVDLKDEIKIKRIKEPAVHFYCSHPELPAGGDNICVRAANLLIKNADIQNGVEIHLKKNIPIGAGLGGGSSNAAVVLLGLNKLWNLNLQHQQLLELAGQLGSDVPFFIRGGMALAKGRGEELSTFDTNFDLPILIIYPEIKIITKWAYDQLNLNFTMKKKSIKLAGFKDRKFNDVDFYDVFENEFEEIVFKRYPILKNIKKQINQRNPIFTSLSGSGSAIFGIFRREDEALEAKQIMQRQHSVFVTRPLKWGYEQLRRTLK